MKTKTSAVKVGAGTNAVSIGGDGPLAFILGPCVIESRDHSLSVAAEIKKISERLAVPVVFKSSYDKANRTSGKSFRGLGLEEGCRVLEEVRQATGLAVLTDVHSEEEAKSAAQVVDMIQVPAFLCRQTDLLIACGRTNKPVLVKKGQFLAPEDMAHVAQKISETGNQKVLLCERGTCFGYRDLVVDFRGLQIMREFSYPVVFDGTHSVQQMGGAGGSSSGRREFIPALSRAAVAVGVDAVFLEVHEEPDKAPSDGPNMLPLSQLQDLIGQLSQISNLANKKN